MKYERWILLLIIGELVDRVCIGTWKNKSLHLHAHTEQWVYFVLLVVSELFEFEKETIINAEYEHSEQKLCTDWKMNTNKTPDKVRKIIIARKLNFCVRVFQWCSLQLVYLYLWYDSYTLSNFTGSDDVDRRSYCHWTFRNWTFLPSRIIFYFLRAWNALIHLTLCVCISKQIM